MKSINFTDEELEHLRSYYNNELVVAEKDIERIQTILSKLGASNPVKPEVITEKKTRGRKPKVKTEEVVSIEEVIKKEREPRVVGVEPVNPTENTAESVTPPTPVKKTRKPRSDKGGIRVKPIEPDAKVDVVHQPEPILPPLNEEKMIEPIAKPTPTLSNPYSKDGFKKKKSRPKRPRIYLKNLSKPLPPMQKYDVETPSTEEKSPENVD